MARVWFFLFVFGLDTRKILVYENPIKLLKVIGYSEGSVLLLETGFT